MGLLELGDIRLFVLLFLVALVLTAAVPCLGVVCNKSVALALVRLYTLSLLVWTRCCPRPVSCAGYTSTRHARHWCFDAQFAISLSLYLVLVRGL